MAFSRGWEVPTASLRTSGTGDKVREGALDGDTGRGDRDEGEPPSPEGLPFSSGEEGEVGPLLVWPLTLSRWTLEMGRGWLVGETEKAAALGPSLGLRLGLTPLADWGRSSCGDSTFTTNP